MTLRRAIMSLLALFGLAMSIHSTAPQVQAQTNLLQNPDFENAGEYRRSTIDPRADFAFANGWDGWETNSPSTESWMNIDAIAFPHDGSFKYNGSVSQNIGRGDATFTAAVYQVVNNIPEGTTLRASAWVFQENDPGSSSRTRIGIGSNVGSNPFGSPITWSPWMTSLRSWQQVSVQATVPAGSVTVFIYSTQSQPNAANQNYYDTAELVVVGEGAVDIGDGSEEGTPGATAAPPTNTPQPFAPFVNPQGADETGRIEHVVGSGDTLAAISVAYGVPISQIRDLNGIDGSILRIGQVLLIQEESENPPTSEPEPTEETVEETDSGTTANSGGFASPTPLTVAEADTSSEIVEPEVASTEDVTEEPVVETEEATPEPTNTPSEPTPTPTATLIPPTPTDAPPAPVEQGEDADPLAVEAAICVSMYEDVNNNNIQDGEPLLEGGLIAVVPSNGGDEQQYITDGTSEPFCFEGLETGSYAVSATAPDGFGIVRSSRLVVNVQPGQRFPIRFGAVEGAEVATVATPVTQDTSVTDANPDIVEEEPDALNNLRNVAGIIVLGLAGVVLLGGIGVALVTRGR